MKKRIAIFGGSFNPPGIHHQKIAKLLANRFDVVKIIPCGPRPDKETTNDIEPLHRAVMSDQTFFGLKDNIDVELFDLEHGTFTRNHATQKLYASEGEVWHVVGSDIIQGGSNKESYIHKVWENGHEMWDKLNFVVVKRNGVKYDKKDLPPNSEVINLDFDGSSRDIRQNAFDRQNIDNLVTPEVASYMARYGLFRGGILAKDIKINLQRPRLLIKTDKHNPKAEEIKKRLSHLIDEESPNLVVAIGGDGTMLHTIKDYWRLRVPFFGINVGHVGFLMNDVGADIANIFNNDLILRSSPLLHVEVVDKDGTQKHSLVFNDAWVEAEPGKTGWFEVLVDGETKISHLMGSGVLAATAAGSTAFARAMGAHPLPVGTNLLVVAGSNVSQPLNWNGGVNLPLDSEIIFRTKDKTGWRKIFAFVDGVGIGEVKEMKIRVSRIASAELAFLPNHDIKKKLMLTQFPS